MRVGPIAQSASFTPQPRNEVSSKLNLISET
jgi:hypothetical protein